MSLIGRGIIVFILIVGSFAGPLGPGLAIGRGSSDTLENTKVAPPSLFVNTSLPSSPGRILNVRTSSDLQRALDRAVPGDTIHLEAGAVFVGHFTLPYKRGDNPESDWIVIRSSARNSELPSPGERISPSFVPVMPKLITPDGSPVLRTEPRAHHYRFIGVEFSIGDRVTTNFGLIRLGNGDETDESMLAHDIIIDRCYIHGNDTANLRRGIALNSASSAIIDSYISDCHEKGADSQAICGWNGPGPFKIVNNYLEAAGENVLFGGADARIPGLVPSDIEVRKNHCYKPLSWREGNPEYAGKKWTVKNIFELKNAQRVIIEGNLMENVWAEAQTGYAILFKSVNQDGRAPWSVTQDVEFKNNVVRHCGGGINIQGRSPNQPGGQTKRIRISNNLFEDISGGAWGGDGAFLKINETENITIDHNTVMQKGNMITAYGEQNRGFRFTNNLMPHNSYGVKGDGAGPGAQTLGRYFPGNVFKRNVIAGRQNSSYPRKNFFPDSIEDVGFVDWVNGNYRLAPFSPYKNAATEGTDVGADFDAAELAGIIGSGT